ncbi:MAG: ABC transporter permease [Isosphaeraceae bacterium]|nr:ABC transporter permease [Isosphaeraceae bacterium]
MGTFAWRNLMTRPLRTALALVGLSIPILGVIGLFSVSGGVRNMVGDTLSRVEGVMVVRENAPSPVFSDLPADVGDKLWKVPGIREVAPEIWKIAPAVEGRTLVGTFASKGMSSIFDQPVIQGQDITAHSKLHSAVYPRAVREKGEGRFLEPGDKGKPHVVISRKLAKDFAGKEGKSKQVGDTINIGGQPYKIVGLYETGSILLDVVIVMDIESARKLLKFPDGIVSSFYVETKDPSRNEEVSKTIERTIANIDSRSMNEFMSNFGALMGQLDKFLLMTVSLALLVGVVGIINTMLMSTTERFVEFGVLRTNGWSQGNILSLVTLESAYLGLLSGVVGSLLAIFAVSVANQFLSGGIRLTLPPWLFALGVGLSLVTGTVGGLYPAWRAARLVPMDAIRLGSH